MKLVQAGGRVVTLNAASLQYYSFLLAQFNWISSGRQEVVEITYEVLIWINRMRWNEMIGIEILRLEMAFLKVFCYIASHLFFRQNSLFEGDFGQPYLVLLLLGWEYPRLVLMGSEYLLDGMRNLLSELLEENLGRNIGRYFLLLEKKTSLFFLSLSTGSWTHLALQSLPHLARAYPLFPTYIPCLPRLLAIVRKGSFPFPL